MTSSVLAIPNSRSLLLKCSVIPAPALPKDHFCEVWSKSCEQFQRRSNCLGDHVDGHLTDEDKDHKLPIIKSYKQP